MNTMEALKKYKLYIVGLLVILAILTLVPGYSEKENFLGYQSLCPWAPIATIITLAVALVIYYVAR
ncbi:MAG: hypothetical protein N3F67_03540 [Acidilobaceae archaeon]|nr:hypothetical protein [Acidilobaceae archaeon]